MPEIVTRYPDILIQELKDVGGKCGQGLPPKILKQCPADQFCVLPTGEICVYDLKDMMHMTQISPSDWSEAMTGVPGMFGYTNLMLLLIILAVGLVLGMVVSRKKSSTSSTND